MGIVRCPNKSCRVLVEVLSLGAGVQGFQGCAQEVCFRWGWASKDGFVAC